MRSDNYYNKNKVKIIVCTALCVYLTSIIFILFTLTDGVFSNYITYSPNYRKGYVSSLELTSYNSGEVSDDDTEKVTLSDIDYDMSTLYLDWTEIREEENRIKEEQKRKEEELRKNNVVNKQESFDNNDKDVSVMKTFEVPEDIDSSFKGYMCMHTITSKPSKQWEFLHSGGYEFTTDKNGIMMYNDYYVVALGSYYTGNKIGKTYTVSLDSGISFNVIVGDIKSDMHTDSSHMYRPKGSGRGEIVEFIVACGEANENCNEYDVMDSYTRGLGDLSSLGFQGNVVNIEQLDDLTVYNKLYSK